MDLVTVHWDVIEEMWNCGSKGEEEGKAMQPATGTNLGECEGTNTRGNCPEMPNTSFIIVIHRVPNGNNDLTSRNQVQALYKDLRHWEEQIDFIENNCCPKEPYCLTPIYKWNLTQEEVEEGYMWLYTPGQMMNNPLYGQISYNSSLSNAFKLKLGHNVKLFWVELHVPTGKEIAVHVMKPAKVIHTSLFTVSYADCYSVFLDFRKRWWKWQSSGWGGRWERDW